MTGFLLGAGSAVLLAGFTYLALVELDVSTAERADDVSVKLEEVEDMHPPGVGAD